MLNFEPFLYYYVLLKETFQYCEKLFEKRISLHPTYYSMFIQVFMNFNDYKILYIFFFQYFTSQEVLLGAILT